MFYLLDHDQISADSFSSKMFMELQPVPPESTTQKWTSYIVHPATQICLIFIPEDHVINIKVGVDPTLFETFIQRYIDDGVLEEGVKQEVKDIIMNNQGSSVNVTQIIQDIFDGTGMIMTQQEAIDGGWIETDL